MTRNEMALDRDNSCSSAEDLVVPEVKPTSGIKEEKKSKLEAHIQSKGNCSFSHTA